MSHLSVLFRPEGLVSLISLTVMEIVLGIDNIIFIAILSEKVAHGQGPRVRRLGLALALILRIGLLLTLSWLMGLTAPLFSAARPGVLGARSGAAGGRPVPDRQVDPRALRARRARRRRRGAAKDGAGGAAAAKTASFASTLAQILALDIVFSLDSVITAVGMVPHIPIMITAMVLAVIVMLIFADAVSGFINRHPSMKVLALSFLLLIGVLLVADSFDRHINKGYVYFAMAFSFVVEMINMRVRKRSRRPIDSLRKS